MAKKKTVSFQTPIGEEIIIPFLTQKEKLTRVNQSKKASPKKKKVVEDEMCSNSKCKNKEKFYRDYIEALKKKILDYHNLVNEYEKDLEDSQKSKFQLKMEEERDELFEML